jgi:hypothetical protein
MKSPHGWYEFINTTKEQKRSKRIIKKGAREWTLLYDFSIALKQKNGKKITHSSFAPTPFSGLI